MTSVALARGLFYLRRFHEEARVTCQGVGPRSDEREVASESAKVAPGVPGDLAPSFGLDCRAEAPWVAIWGFEPLWVIDTDGRIGGW